jgi:hypothetical protein
MRFREICKNYFSFPRLLVTCQKLPERLRYLFRWDAYGDKPEWERNVEAARNMGVAVENAIEKLKRENAGEPQNFVSLTAIKEQRLPMCESEAVENA